MAVTLLSATGGLPIQRAAGSPFPPPSATSRNEPSPGGTSFAEMLKGYLSEVRNLEDAANQQVQGLASGSPTEVHEVMMAVEEANLALDLLIEIRNRLLDTYQQLSRTSM